MIGFDLDSMRIYSKLTQGDLEGMHPMLARICRSNNKSIFELREVCKVESHLGSETLMRCNPRALNLMLVNALSHNLVKALFI
jgi:hypothetical protein